MQSKITVTEAAKILGVTRQRINARIKDGSLIAEKFGNFYLLDKKQVEKLKK